MAEVPTQLPPPSAATISQQRLAFCRWLVNSGRVTDGSLCAICQHAVSERASVWRRAPVLGVEGRLEVIRQPICAVCAGVA